MEKLQYQNLLHSLLLRQYENSETVKGIVSGFANQAQKIEDLLWEFVERVWFNLDEARGVFLDRIGATVGVFRSGRDDETYRTLIRLGIAVNVGGAEPELICAVVKAVYSASYARYEADYPAGFNIFQDGLLGLYFEGSVILDETENNGERISFHDNSLMTYRESDSDSVALVERLAPAGVEMTIIQE